MGRRTCRSGTPLMKRVFLTEKKSSQSAVIFSRPVALGKFPQDYQNSHTPIKGFDFMAAEDNQRAERGRRDEEQV